MVKLVERYKDTLEKRLALGKMAVWRDTLEKCVRAMEVVTEENEGSSLLDSALAAARPFLESKEE
jgi:hypothetical protein